MQAKASSVSRTGLGGVWSSIASFIDKSHGAEETAWAYKLDGQAWRIAGTAHQLQNEFERWKLSLHPLYLCRLYYQIAKKAKSRK